MALGAQDPTIHDIRYIALIRWLAAAPGTQTTLPDGTGAGRELYAHAQNEFDYLLDFFGTVFNRWVFRLCSTTVYLVVSAASVRTSIAPLNSCADKIDSRQ